MPANTITGGTTTIDLLQAPLRESSEDQAVYQVSGLDSAGRRYVYDKATILRATHKLVYPRLSSAVLSELLAFHDDVAEGDKNTFTWYDHDGSAHTVRITGAIGYREIAYGQHRTELTLEEDLVWLPAPDTRLSGTYAAPYWVFEFNVDGSSYLLLATNPIKVWSFTAKPWIESFGTIQGGVTNGLGEYQVSDLSLSVLVDTSFGVTDIITFVTGPSYKLEKGPSRLWLYNYNGSDRPLEVWRGYLADVEIPDETTVSLMLEDESSRLQKQIGTLINPATYPSADPDDVGKVIPIIYNSVAKLPVPCVRSGWVSSLLADIGAEDTAITVSEVPGYSLADLTIIIDDEKMLVTAQTGTSLTVDRGEASTIPAVHTAGTVALEVMADPIVYLLADHPVTSIDKVYTRVNGVDIDITAACTLYLGTEEDEHASYPGMAVATIADIPAIRNKINLTLIETGHSHNAASSSAENCTISLPAAMVYYGSYPQPSGYPYSPGLCMYKHVTFPSSGGSRTACTYSVTLTPTTTRTCRILLVISGVCKWWADVYIVSGVAQTMTFTAEAEASANSFDVVQIGSGAGSYFNITACSRMVYLSSVPSTYSASGAALSGNSVADTLVGSMVLVDMARTMTDPEIFDDLLARAGSAATITISGDQTLWSAASLSLSGAITEYKPAKYWLNLLAFQLRSWFRLDRGIAQLIIRPDTLTSTAIIPACALGPDGKKKYRRRKAELSDVINRVNLLFDRDWSKPGGADAYRKVSSASDAGSIYTYGEREQPELFRFDFITGTAAAEMLRDYYLGYYKTRRWLHEFETYLDRYELEFGDVVTLAFSDNQVGQILNVGFNPGSSREIDTIRFTVAV